ncbi:MAG: hypothetical protein MJY67_09100 [Bacteroidales bacterium]|nr:hypothetical protein [Bacteroidales bacterium]
MIVVANKRKKFETIQREYPGAVVVDVTSNSKDGDFVRFSPFYPHRGIPVPGMTVKASCVEGIWQGLKTFEGEGISMETLRNDTMKNIKRTVRVHGRCLGHLYQGRLLSYIEARKLLYLPSYKWVLDNKLGALVEKLRALSAKGTLVLLDYETNCDVLDGAKPMSHAGLIKAYIEGTYPVFNEEGVMTGVACAPEAASVSASAPEASAAVMASSGVCEDEAYFTGERVRHAKFGEGTVESFDPSTGRILVNFTSVGTKTLIATYAKLEKI